MMPSTISQTGTCSRRAYRRSAAGVGGPSSATFTSPTVTEPCWSSPRPRRSCSTGLALAFKRSNWIASPSGSCAVSRSSTRLRTPECAASLVTNSPVSSAGLTTRTCSKTHSGYRAASPLDAALGLQPAVRDGLGELLEVALVLVCVGRRELGDRVVERHRVAQVAGDRDLVAGPGVRPGQGVPAHLAVQPQAARNHHPDIERELPVPELPDIEVALLPIQPGHVLPAEEDVTGRLHQALPVDHALALVAVLAGPGVGTEHRVLRLLDLQEERIGVVPAEQQNDPAPGPDAAHADHLAGHVS